MRSVLLSVAMVLLVVGSLRGQALDEVERLALSGQAEQARVLLTDWWEESFGDATRLDRQKGLWLRGLLTVDPRMAELDFQRLVVEYPGGRYTSEALVRLGGAAEARGEMARADRFFRTLLRDYPGSRYETLARAWIRDHPDASTAVSKPDSAVAPTGSERAASADPPDSIPERREAPEASVGRYAVQLGAFGSRDRAVALAERARATGLTVRIVQVDGSPLHRVRLGQFANESDAETERDRVVEMQFEATVVSNADQESSGA